jgi:hypothetical protein
VGELTLIDIGVEVAVLVPQEPVEETKHLYRRPDIEAWELVKVIDAVVTLL